MITTECAICETKGNAKLLYKERLPVKGVDASVYAPRRERDFFHYRMVKCKGCELVRSDPIMEDEKLNELYKESPCTYSDKNEHGPLRKTYGRYLKQLLKKYPVKTGEILDIGCADGFFLEEALKLGFEEIFGVEPARDAIECAHSSVKPHIVQGMFDENMFKTERFDVVVFFQTLDHIADPNIFLKACFRVLKKGGFILAINHNVGAFSAKIMRERSPIIDIGHAYLYDLKTMRKIFEKNGFEVKNVFSVKNTISIDYLFQLISLPRTFKESIKRLISFLRIGRLNLTIRMGNLGIIARKP